ncbi:MAG TPA: alcohol dehydrogenase, partial [Planctomycetaceae bacterium]|nr:alcohol dehydrogenase [Planctomycetaceae bacterium]
LIRVTHDGTTWSTAKMWDSLDIKPNFNDYVAVDGYLYGFDGNVFACVDLATGKRKWKRGRYGFGQVLLVQPQQLLVIQAESGEVVLVEASSKELVERGKFPALGGKTWNHPVIAHGKLLVRNGEEMACYDVAPVETTTAAVP